MYDVIVIGGGPAGLTAALYALRANKSVLIIEKGGFGGQITYSPKVENIPGFISLSGNEFAEKLTEQVMDQGADIEIATVTGVKDNGSNKTVVTDSGDFIGTAVIIATGAKHRMLGLEREEQFVGEGISFCAVCDGAFYKDKTVAVIGGGNSALQEALLLSEGCKKVIMVQNLDRFTGEERMIEQLQAKSNVAFITSAVVNRLIGEKDLEGIEIRHQDSGELSVINVDGMFVAIGLLPQNEPFNNIIALNEYGYADSDEFCLTKTPGVFVAGDCRSKYVRQVTTACADGAVAALTACRYIDGQ